MLIEAVALFLAVSILFYCVFAGADFGAGILEFFSGKQRQSDQKEIITHAMGPVWEANHVWLVLIVVILFNGFPKVFSQLSITFHVPLTLMLMGIVLRGCAFTFRYYDAVRDRSQKYYSAAFIVSSLFTPFMLGMIAGGVMIYSPVPDTADYWTAYISPWSTVFSVSVGVFVCALFAFLAAVFLVGETQDPELQQIFRKRARVANIASVIAGVFVFFAAEVSGVHLIAKFFSDPISSACMAAATILLLPLWKTLKSKWPRHMIARVLVAAQIGFVLFGWFKIQYPSLLGPLTFYNSAAPELVLWYLLVALIGGSLLIFPSLFYLMHVFKLRSR